MSEYHRLTDQKYSEAEYLFQVSPEHMFDVCKYKIPNFLTKLAEKKKKQKNMYNFLLILFLFIFVFYSLVMSCDACIVSFSHQPPVYKQILLNMNGTDNRNGQIG